MSVSKSVCQHNNVGLLDAYCPACETTLEYVEEGLVGTLRSRIEELEQALEYLSDSAKYDVTVTRYARAALLQEAGDDESHKHR